MKCSVPAICYFFSFFMWSVNCKSLNYKDTFIHFYLVLSYIETLISAATHLFSYILLVRKLYELSSETIQYILDMSTNKPEHYLYLKPISIATCGKISFNYYLPFQLLICSVNCASSVCKLFTFFRTVLNSLAQLLLEVN